jgi:hypothetical protein
MTPKEKAEELLLKFRGIFFRNMSDKDAKRCALIAVNEIINIACDVSDYDKSVTKSYWIEVKQEIEKL